MKAHLADYHIAFFICFYCDFICTIEIENKHLHAQIKAHPHLNRLNSLLGAPRPP